jgi:hypothetical protein
MQISDLVASVTQTSTRRKSSLAYPTEAPRAPAIEAKHAAASARAGQLRASFNVHALAAAEEREPDGPAAQAFDQLKRMGSPHGARTASAAAPVRTWPLRSV